jgi:hypothetical protein
MAAVVVSTAKKGHKAQLSLTCNMQSTLHILLRKLKPELLGVVVHNLDVVQEE